MLRLMISQSGLHSNGCRVAGVGRTNFHRALTGSVLLLLASLFLLSSFTWAQEVTASIVGTVIGSNNRKRRCIRGVEAEQPQQGEERQ